MGFHEPMPQFIGFTAFYVLPFYLSPLTRPSPILPRDSPTVIRARVTSVTLSCTICSLVTIYIFRTYAHASLLETLKLLGWYPISLLDVFKPILLTALLFAGPLFERGVVESGWREWIRGRKLLECLRSWEGFRNYIAGPLTEELLFRSLLLPLALLSFPPLPPSTPSPRTEILPTILLTPLSFGIAHIHHFYEFTLTHPRTPLLPALAVTIFQFTYTTLFGWFAAFVFLRTGSLGAVVGSHAFCNWMGLPRVWGRVGAGVVGRVGGQTAGKRAGEGRVKEEVKGSVAGEGNMPELKEMGQETVMGEMSGKGGDDVARDTGSPPHTHINRPGKVFQAEYRGLGIGWTVAYYILLVGGAVTFWKAFWVLTKSENALVEWGDR
ncbi:hypothetical protein MMC30_005577 [Trapelia coarctata]|nr:hypothetical protein [Trapelia coarctata]